jgi:hypothetical protein
LIPRELRDLYATNPAECPGSFWTGGERAGSPALILATCRKRTCPVCGPRWILQNLERFAHHFARHDGQLYRGEVADYDWRAVAADMRRQAKKLGAPLRYVAVRQGDESTLVILASVPVGEVARPVETPEAVDVLRHSLDGAAMGPRPVQACRAWGKLPKAVEVKRVPHRCSVKAFRDTVRAWGSGVESGARFIVAERDGLFLDETGHVDYAARVDFWTEAELRDCPGFGADDADEYHQRAAARRERLRQKPPPGPPPPPAAGCQHGDVAETLTFDGHVNRQCRECGEWLPCRRANRAP